jgi:hypothetical protein
MTPEKGGYTMPRFFIELSHRDEHDACVRALQAIEQFGSHFMTNAEWGCKDGTHSGWLIAELASRDEVLQMLPPQYRQEARIVELNRFTREEIVSLITELEGGSQSTPKSSQHTGS